MKLFLRSLKRLLLMLAFLAGAAVLAGMIYVRTTSFGRLVKGQVSGLLATNFRGQVTLGEVDSSAWGTLTIRGLEVKDGNVTVVRIPKVRLGYSLIPLLWHEVRIEVVAVEPKINLERAPDGQWNLMNALASKSPPTAGSSANAFTIYIDKLGIRDGAIDLALAGVSGPHYRFETANLDAHLAVKPGGVDADLTALRTRVVTQGHPPTNLHVALSYKGANGLGEISIKAVDLTTQASAASISGVIRNVQTFDSDIAIAISKLAPSDLSTIMSRSPIRTDLNGRIHLKGVATAMRMEASLASGKARLDANLEGDLTRKAPTFDGYLSLDQLDLSALALPEQLAGVLDLSIQARGEGSDLQALVASATIRGQAVRMGRTSIGNFDLASGAQRGDVRFDGKFINGAGRLNLDGTAIISATPRYHIVVNTEHLNIAGVSHAAPPSDLNSRMVVQGSGNALQNIDARIDFQAVHSLVARVPLKATFQARMNTGVLHISQAEILSQGSTVSIKGSAGIEPGAETQLTYQVRSNQIAPWLKLAGMTGYGRLFIDGTTAGVVRSARGASLRAQGRVDLQSAHVPSLTIASANTSYSFDKIGQDAWPRGSVKARFTTLEVSGIKLRAVDGQMWADGGRPPHIRLAMVVHDERNSVDRLAARIVYQPGRVVGSLDQLILVLQDGTWHLLQPAQFTKDGRQVGVEGFALVNGVRRLTLDASIAPAGEQKVLLRAHAIDLAVFRPLIPPPQPIAGEVSAEIRVNGTSTAPLIEANLGVSHLALNSQRLGDLNALVHYRAPTVTLDVSLNEDRNHQLKLSGDIPLYVQWAHGFAATIGNNQNMRLYSAGIELKPFGGIAPQTLRSAAGLFQVDIRLTGPPLHPMINGTLAITAGGGEVVPTGVTVTDFAMRLRASPTKIEIAELSAQAGDGTLSGSGSMALGNNYSPGAINATVQIHHWPAIATQQYNVKSTGQIHAEGTPNAPVIQGEVEVVDTTVHPDLDFLSGTSVPPSDDTIVVIRPGQTNGYAPTSSGRTGVPSGQHAGAQVFNNLSLDLKINIKRNTWIRHEDAQIELDGRLNIKKRAVGPISLVGEIDTVRGWLQFHSKRFTLASGQILFTGGPNIDSTLNIDAQNAVSDYTIDVIVAGTASKPEIKLQSQPELAQADILSLILFGTTSSQLGQNQKATLQQQAQSMAAGVAGQALSESLGLASLGVDVNGESVGFGHYLNENTYVSVSPNFGASTSSTPSQLASIQYFFRRWLTITTATMSDGSRQVFLNVNKRY
jgi:autotransporter translocation and assembly factor TamB